MNRRIDKLHGLIATVLFAAACSGGAASSGQETTPEGTTPGTGAASIAPAGDTDVLAACIQVQEREAQCTDEFIPMLVDLRIKHDLPAGIAAEGQTEEGRQGLVEKAKTEWAEDSKPENIQAACERGVTTMPPEALEAMAKQGTECLAAADCTAFVACVAPLHDQMFMQQKARQAQ